MKKIDIADKLFAKLIKKRGHCQKCNTTKDLDCAHIVGRSNKLLRYNPDNSVCMCRKCHRWAHDNPKLFVEWYKENYPINHAFLMREKNRMDYNLGQSIEFTIKCLKEALGGSGTAGSNAGVGYVAGSAGSTEPLIRKS